MSEKRIEKLARNLRRAYARGSIFGWDDLDEERRESWRRVARVAIAEVGKLPKKPKKAAEPKACRIDEHGRKVCN